MVCCIITIWNIHMNIEYSFETEKITLDALVKLFSSIGWDSANYPEKLYKAIINSHSVVTAWDGDRLVGLANALADGALTALISTTS